MKKTFTLKAHFFGLKFTMLLFAFLLISGKGWGQQLLPENFSYTIGTDLSANGWNIHGAATPTLAVTASSISYPGYLSSGIGDEVSLAVSGQDVNKTFTSQTSGTVYASYLVNVTTATLAGDYFFHLGASTIGSTYHGRVYVKRDASNKLAFGISRAGAVATAVFTPFSYDMGTTYLIVLRYTIVSGTTNDLSAIYINPTLNAVEPVTGWISSTDTPTDLANIGSVALRQGGASTGAALKLDGIRVALSWSDIVGPVSNITPTLTADITNNNVDNNIDITFTDDATWRAAITAVKIGTTSLTPTTDYLISSGNIQLIPSGLNSLLTTAGSKAITVVATGYTDATVTQQIDAGSPTSNSTASIDLPLNSGVSRTITCTAKDNYNNLVSGYTFKYDATITNNNSTITESYTLDGSSVSTTTNDISVVATTNGSGVATFTAALPATIDGADGISIQVQLNNGTTNIGSAYSFYQLASQTITFGALAAVTYGDAPFTVSATGGGSGNPVVFTSSDPLIATCTGTNGTTVTIIKNGSCTIHANQAGNGSYNAAPQVDQTLVVNQKALTIPDAVAQDKVYTGTDAAIITGTLTGIVGADVVTLNGTGTFADVNVGSNIAVTSSSTLAGADNGKYTLTQPIGLTANITQATQTITFPALANKTLGDPDYNPGATSATSGINPITYASSNLAVATIVASQIHIVGVGSTTITASQGSSANYLAATDVPQNLNVLTPPLVAWQFGSPAALGTEVTYNATTNNSNLNTSVLSRGSGIAPTALARGFSANNWDVAATKTTAVSTNEYYQFTIKANTGYQVSLSTLDATLRRSATGPNAYIWEYSTDGTTFNEIGTDISFTSTADGLAQSQISLAGITALQNVTYATTITFRLYAWGGNSTTSTFAIARYAAGNTSNCLAIGGEVALAPPPTVVWVDDDFTSGTSGGHGWGYDAFATIQEGINAVDINGAVNLAAGSYEESITINKSVTINGAGQGSTIVVPAVSDPGGDGGPSFSNSQVMVVSANNVTISNLTIDGYNPLLSPVTPVIRNGVRIDARNGIIESDGPWNNLHVSYVTVKNIYLRGIYARSGGTGFHFDHNTVENIDGGGSSIAIFNFGGSGVIEDNSVTTVNDGISSNWSTGTQYLHNIVTDSKGYGIHSDNNGTVADYIHGNIINSPNTDTWGVMVFFPRNVNPVVDSNTVNNAAYGLVAYGGDNPSTATAIFTNNIIDGQNKTNSGGIIVITGQNAWIPYGYYVGSVGASFAGNTILNTDYGLQIESETGYSATLTALSGNTIAGSIEDITVWGLGSISSSGLAGNKVEVLNPGKIQVGINVAASGGTVNVDAGIYNEYSINISKALNLKGANADIPLGSRGTETKIQDLTGSGAALINTLSDGITINGFELTSTGANNAIYCGNDGPSNLNIKFNNIHDIGTARGSGNVYAINYRVNNPSPSNVNISDNIFNEIFNATSAALGHSAAIWLGQSTANGTVSNLTIERNTISNVKTGLSSKEASGIYIGVAWGAGTGKVQSPVIRFNSITDIKGGIAYAIQLSGKTPGAVVSNNTINNIINLTTPSTAAIGVAIPSTNTGSASISVNNNSITNVLYAITNGTANTVDATCNWYGTTVPSAITALINGHVTYIPYSISDGGACSGVPAPTGPSTQTYCSNESKKVSDLTLTLSGTSIQWYSAASGGILYSPSTVLVTGSYYASQTIAGIESTDRKAVAVTVNTALTPYFTQLGPYWSGSYVPALPGTSNNGITGTWNPPTISTATLGTTVFTFTPTSGQCANQATMPISIITPIPQFGITQDIGTTVLAYWPPVVGAAFYGFQYRPAGNPSLPWIGSNASTNVLKVTNLTPGLPYECRIVGYLPSGFPVGLTQTGNFTPQIYPYTKDKDMGTTCMMGWNDWTPWATSYSFQYKKKFGGSWLNYSEYDPLSKITTIPDTTYVCRVVVYKAGYVWGTTQLGEFKADAYGSSVTNATGTSLDLTWTNFNTGDPAPWVVDQYIKYRVKNSSSGWLQAYAAGGTNTVHLTGLTPNTDYEFQVHVYQPLFWGSTPLGFLNSGTVKVGNANNTNDGIHVYPNPFADQMNIDLFSNKETNLSWSIYDMTGKVVLSGNNSITSGYSTFTLNAEDLPNGVYMLNAIMDDQMQSFRIMKQ